MLARMLLIVVYSVAIHACYLGGKIVVSLYALHPGASQTTLGVLAALYASMPLILGIYSGRLVDSNGTRWPLAGGAAVVGLGMLTGGLGGDLTALFATALLTGAGFTFFNVAIQTLTGSLGNKDQRARNFALLSFGQQHALFAIMGCIQ
jgi:MFS family permease